MFRENKKLVDTETIVLKTLQTSLEIAYLLGVHHRTKRRALEGRLRRDLVLGVE